MPYMLELRAIEYYSFLNIREQMLQNQKTNEEFSIHKKGRYAEIRRRIK